MARPRKKEIALSSLDCFSIIEDELSTKAELSDFDIAEAQIIIKQKKPPYVPNPDTVKKAIYRLSVYLLEKDTLTPIPLSKNQLSKILRISRPTLDKWLNANIIAKNEGDSIDISEELQQTLPYITAQATLKSLKEYQG